MVLYLTVLCFCSICELNGVYGEGEFRGDVAFPYMIALNNLSQFVAMYCLVLFYRANAEALKPMKPVGKFLCIKAVVFFSFLYVLCNVYIFKNITNININIDRNKMNAYYIFLLQSRSNNIFISILQRYI